MLRGVGGVQKPHYLQPSDYERGRSGGEGECRKDFYTFCVRLKSVTDSTLVKRKRDHQGLDTVYLCLSQSQNYTSQNQP